MMRAKQGVVNTRPIVESASESLAAQIHQVLIPGLVFTKQYEMAAFAVRIAFIIHVCAQIHLASDNGMNAGILTGSIKINHPVEHAVICHGTGIHTQRFQAFGQFLDAAGAVQKTVFSVQMQMRERHRLTSECCLFIIRESRAESKWTTMVFLLD